MNSTSSKSDNKEPTTFQIIMVAKRYKSQVKITHRSGETLSNKTATSKLQSDISGYNHF